MGKYDDRKAGSKGSVDQSGDKDAELFLHAMANLGVKTGARSAKPLDPAKVDPDRDFDFDQFMQGARGPAKMDRGAGKAKGDAAVEVVVAGDPRGTEARSAAIEVKRYTASEEEAAQFAAAMSSMSAIDPGAIAPRESQDADRKKAKPREPLASLVKRGREPEAVLDLHGRTREEARPKLEAFLREAVAERWEIVSIVVGRGAHSERGEPVLGPAVSAWLADDHRGDVIEAIPAPRYLGGTGTIIALVRLDKRG